MKESVQVKKCVIYARVSSKEQERDGFSIPAQNKFLKEYALKNGLRIVEEFSDSETAKHQGRTNFNKMLEFFKENKDVNILLVEKTDRLYRNFKDYVTLEDYDLEIHLAKEGSIISKNSRSHDKFIHGIKVLMAKNYIDNLSEEISKGLREAIEEGFWPFKPPYGYKRGKDKHLEISEHEGLFVYKAFEYYASGKYSLRKLVDKLYEDGYYYSVKKPKIHRASLVTILKNPMYTGILMYCGGIHVGKHSAIVSKELFDKAQKGASLDRKSKHRKHFDFAYAGLNIQCHECGYQMTAELKKNKYIYYHCTQTDKTCSHTKYVQEEVLSRQFKNQIKRIALPDELYNKLKEVLKDSLGEQTNYHKQQVAEIAKSIEKTEDELRRMYTDRLEGLIDTNMWIDLKKHAEGKLYELKMKQKKYEQANIDYLEYGVQILDVCTLAGKPSKELTPKMIAQILDKTTKKITVKNEKVKVQFSSPYNIVETLKKRLKTASLNGSSRMEWWARRDSNSHTLLR